MTIPRPRPVRFLTVQETASFMRVSKMTIYRLCHEGTIESVRVGHQFRIIERALHDYLAEQSGWWDDGGEEA